MALPKGIGGDPARDAAQSALQDALANQKAGGAPGAGLAAGEKAPRWEVPKLPTDLNVGEAVKTAMHRAAGYLNQRMQGEGVVVNVQQGSGENSGNWEALITDDHGGTVMQRYGGTDLLRLYASQSLKTGVVVDGEV